VRWLDEQGEIKIEKAGPEKKKTASERRGVKADKPPRLYLFGVNQSRLMQMAREMHLDLEIADNLKDASLLVTSKNYYRRKPQKVRDAESANLPIYVLRSNTPPQMKQLLGNIYHVAGADRPDYFKEALGEAEEAVTQVEGGQEAVDLSPQSAYIRRLQHLIAQRSNLASHSIGKDPERRVRIYKGQS
jgi:hypothetical protein